jgi:hypothetical protein
MMFKIKTNIIILAFLIIFSFLFFLQLYFSNDVNIKAQTYLENIYENSKVLKQDFPVWINPNFTKETENSIFIIRDILDPDFFKHLRTSFENKTFDSMNYGMRKGNGINFIQLHQSANYSGVLELYYSNTLLDTVSEIVGKSVQRTPLSDPNAESMLIYVNEGDHIDWHKDYSNYYGDRYVGLITLVNENADKTGLSAGAFQYKIGDKEYSMHMPENSFMIFKGSEIVHRGTPILPGEKRILISMVFCDICQENTNIFNKMYEKIKNFAVYGIDSK